MFRVLMVTGLLAVTAAPVVAQNAVGFRAGLGIASVTGDAGNDTESLSELTLGIDFDVPVSGSGSLRSSLSWTQKGGAVPVTPDGRVDLRMDYVQLAPLVRTAFGQRRFAFVAQFGPWLAFNTSCDMEARISGIEVSASCSELAEELRPRRLDYGWVGGGGFEYRVSADLSLNLEWMYYRGLIDIGKSLEGKTDFQSIHVGLVKRVGSAPAADERETVRSG